MAPIDETTPKPRAWLRFAVDGSEGIFLSDRHAWSERHRAHSWANRGTIVGEDQWTERYLVGAFPLDTTYFGPCEVCGEADALILGSGVSHVLYVGPEIEIAERIFNEAID